MKLALTRSNSLETKIIGNDNEIFCPVMAAVLFGFEHLAAWIVRVCVARIPTEDSDDTFTSRLSSAPR